MAVKKQYFKNRVARLTHKPLRNVPFLPSVSATASNAFPMSLPLKKGDPPQPKLAMRTAILHLSQLVCE